VLQLVAFAAAWHLLLRLRLEAPALLAFSAVGGVLGVRSLRSAFWTYSGYTEENRAPKMRCLVICVLPPWAVPLAESIGDPLRRCRTPHGAG
jgi:hypothetical protein